MRDVMKNNHEINPLMIQSYFDGEMKSGEIGAVSREELANTPTWQALDELRHVVRADAELAMDRIDSYALLDAINRQIDAESKPKAEAVPMPASRRSAPAKTWVRWMPAIIGAALFLMSIPGIVQLVRGTGDGQSAPKTVVYINDSGASASNYEVQSAKQAFLYDMERVAQTVAAPNRVQGDSQLTVQELDFALRKIVSRIEMLEEANRQNIEHGKTSLDARDDGQVPNKL